MGAAMTAHQCLLCTQECAAEPGIPLDQADPNKDLVVDAEHYLVSAALVPVSPPYDKGASDDAAASMFVLPLPLPAVSQNDNRISDCSLHRVHEETPEFGDGDILWKTLDARWSWFENEFGCSTEQLCKSLEANTCDFSASLADPDRADCPLVYVSPGFETLTGYKADFALGRSCRFLQPSSPCVNDCVNLSERKKLRIFCSEQQKVGSSTVSLLLNEHSDGKRFWMLLKLVHVNISGKKYILGLQTRVKAFMPKTLQSITFQHTTNQQIVLHLEDFARELDRVREFLQAHFYMRFFEQRVVAASQIDALEKQDISEMLQDDIVEMRQNVQRMIAA